MMIVPGDSEREVVGTDTEQFYQIVGGEFLYSSAEEKTRRHDAYRRVGKELCRLLPTGNDVESVHRTYLEVNGDTAERRVLLCRTMFPRLGILHRVIVNDEVSDPATGGRSLHIRDTIVSPTNKVLSAQGSTLRRQHLDNAWKLSNEDGPLLQMKADGLGVVSGNRYHLLLPKTFGYPKGPEELLSDRLALETILEDIVPLNGVSQEVDLKSKQGFMS